MTGFEDALVGKTVIWIGALTSAAAILEAVEKAGAVVERHPVVEFAPPEDEARLEELLARLDTYDWLVFTSVQAVRVMDGRPRPRGRIGAVGPGTAAQLERQGWTADLIPARHDAEGLAEAMIDGGMGAGSVLFVRGDKASRVLPSRLASVGYDVVEVEGYLTRPLALARARIVVEKIREAADLVIAGSSLGVRTLSEAANPIHLGEIRPAAKWLCLGRVTQRELILHGVQHPVFPEEITPSGVIRTAQMLLGNPMDDPGPSSAI